MAIPINMPQVGQDIETARIIEWHVKPGDIVSEGDLIATVESDKASFEVEANADGTVLQLLYKPGEEAVVFKPIAYIGKENEIMEEIKSSPEKSPQKKNEVSKTGKHPGSSEDREGQLHISPSARRIALEHNISLSELTGVASTGMIRKEDVLEFINRKNKAEKEIPVASISGGEEETNPQQIKASEHVKGILKEESPSIAGNSGSKKLQPAKDDTVLFFNKTRKRIAEKLTFSKHTIPHYYLFSDIDITNAIALKEKTFAQTGVKISINDIIIKATSSALLEHQELNSYVDEEKILIKKDINIGIAVATPEGLLVPVIHNPQLLNLAEIHETSLKLAEDARRGIVKPEYTGTFTITNLGMFGVSNFQAIINPPESAILSIGAVEKRVIHRKGEIVISDMLTTGLACDHRAVDGATAAGFLGRIKEIIENIK